jgi:hypothetical protein
MHAMLTWIQKKITIIHNVMFIIQHFSDMLKKSSPNFFFDIKEFSCYRKIMQTKVAPQNFTLKNVLFMEDNRQDLTK